MDSRIVSTSIVVALVVLVLALMHRGWRARQSRQSHLATPLPVPADPGVVVARVERAFYVATTTADAPLDRIAVHGLGFRARASVDVTLDGVVVALAGRDPFLIPAADLVRVDRATAAIDRVVEPGGLVRITWRLGGTPIDSYLRVTDPDDPAGLIDAIDRTIQTHGVGNEIT